MLRHPTRLRVDQVHRWAFAIQRAADLFRLGRFAELYFGPAEQLDANCFPGFRPAVLYWIATAERERLTYALPLEKLGITLADLPTIEPSIKCYQADFLADCQQLWNELIPALPFQSALDDAALTAVTGLPEDWLARFNHATDWSRRQPATENAWGAWCDLALVARTAQSIETIRAALVLAELDTRTDLSALMTRISADFGRRLNDFFFTRVLGGITDDPRATGERLGRNGVFAEHDLSKTHIQPFLGMLTLVGAWLGGPPLTIETTIRTCSFQTQTQVVLAAEGYNPKLGSHLCTLCAAFDQATLDAVLPTLLKPRSRLHASLGRGDTACRFTAELG